MTEEKFLKRLELIKRLQNDKIIDKQEAELLLEYEKEEDATSTTTRLADKLKDLQEALQEAYQDSYNKLPYTYTQTTTGTQNITLPTSELPSSNINGFQKGLLNGNNLSQYLKSPVFTTETED